MAATVQTAIWMALRAQLEVLALNPALAIAWPKEPFDLPSLAAYLDVRHFLNEPESITTGSHGYTRHQGILQISIMYPVGLQHRASEVDLQIAGQIAAHFKLGTEITSGGIVVRVERPAAVKQAFPDDGYWRTPILIRWFCDEFRT